jgi:adenosine deaminase
MDLQNAIGNPRTKEQLEQESSLLIPDKFHKLLIAARNIRFYFWNYFFPSTNTRVFAGNIRKLLAEILSEAFTITSGHPFAALIGEEEDLYQKMPVESMMYILILNDLRKNNNERLASLFHFYLLILGLANRLLVQQTHQKGFQQFQKHTLNGLRWQSESTYFRRYFQLNGNEQRFISFLEGRFAPREQEGETVQLVDAIYAGWELLLNQRSTMGFSNMPQLKLIAHFIKQEDNEADSLIRHAQLRMSLWRKGSTLRSLVRQHLKYGQKIVGIDAASSEFDTPPEVFGPVFRLMRRSGFRHFTFHAGEDFYHIASGLRAIYEAIKFCGLKNGDRIGHATAAGLPASLWEKQVGNKLLMKKTDVLDDLIFTYHMIVNQQTEEIDFIIPSLIHEATKLGYEIYEKVVPITVWERAWLLRQCCPMHALSGEIGDIPNQYFDHDEWAFIDQTISAVSHLNRFDQEGRTKLDEIDLLARYHSARYRARGNEAVEVNPFNILSVDVITQLQLGLLRYMNSNEIVIETLPTSNVRIGIHQDFGSYHLHNWLRWRQEGKSIPPVIIGSDDAGIFATNIYNEYANIYCSMLAQGKPLDTVMEIIKKLVEDAKVYRFYGPAEDEQAFVR